MSRSNHDSTASLPPNPTDPAPDETPDDALDGIEVQEQTPDGGLTGSEDASAENPPATQAQGQPTAPAGLTDDDEPPPELVWYVLKVQSSREDTIRDALQRRVKIQGLQRYFGQIVVPTEKITEIRNNKKRIVE